MFQICPELERRYLINFGILEFGLYKKDVDLLVFVKCIFWKKFSGIDKWSKITIPL